MHGNVHGSPVHRFQQRLLYAHISPSNLPFWILVCALPKNMRFSLNLHLHIFFPQLLSFPKYEGFFFSLLFYMKLLFEEKRCPFEGF